MSETPEKKLAIQKQQYQQNCITDFLIGHPPAFADDFINQSCQIYIDG